MTQLTLDRQISVRPPAAPWSPLRVEQPSTGYLSMYLADNISRLPVRHITRPRDNKSDPNIETGTYGLFSTCEHQMRSGIANCPRGPRRIGENLSLAGWERSGSGFRVRRYFVRVPWAGRTRPAPASNSGGWCGVTSSPGCFGRYGCERASCCSAAGKLLR